MIPTRNILPAQMHGSELEVSMQDLDRVMMDRWPLGA